MFQLVNTISRTMFILVWFQGAACIAYGSGVNEKHLSGVDADLEKTIVMVMASLPEIHEAKWLMMIYTDAFERIGISLVIKYYPPKRCSYLTDTEQVDGDIWRIYRYGEIHDNLVRVDEPTYSAFFSAYSLDPDLRLDGWNSLVGTSFKVDYRRGINMCETNLPRVVKPENLGAVNSVRSGLLKLLVRRIDVYVGVQSSVSDALNTDEFRHSGILKSGTMEVTTMHAWFIRKRKHLAPQLSTVLKQMKREGVVEHYRKVSGDK